MRKYTRKTWRDIEEEYGLDYETMYYQKLGGVSWDNLAEGHISLPVLYRTMKEYCNEHGIDYYILSHIKQNKAIVLGDPRMVDRGKVFALHKAHWNIREIAIDCHCTEECVEVILGGQRGV